MNVKQDITLSMIKRLDTYGVLAVSLNEKMTKQGYFKRLLSYMQLYILNYKCLRLLIDNRIIWPSWPFKLVEVLEQAGLVNKDKVREIKESSTEALDAIIWFLSANINQTPLQVESGFRQADIIPVYNQVINKKIDHFINMALCYHDPKKLNERLKKLANDLKQTNNVKKLTKKESTDNEQIETKPESFKRGNHTMGNFIVNFREAGRTY